MLLVARADEVAVSVAKRPVDFLFQLSTVNCEAISDALKQNV